MKKEPSTAAASSTQKTLSVVLDEIEATAKKWLGDLPHCDCEGCVTALNTLALVKALRYAMPSQLEGQITAILTNAGDKSEKILEE